MENLSQEQATETAFAAVVAGGDIGQSAALYGVSTVDVQGFCGDTDEGHRFETTDNGAESWYYSQWSQCAVCGAPDDREPDGAT